MRSDRIVGIGHIQILDRQGAKFNVAVGRQAHAAAAVGKSIVVVLNWAEELRSRMSAATR